MRVCVCMCVFVSVRACVCNNGMYIKLDLTRASKLNFQLALSPRENKALFSMSTCSISCKTCHMLKGQMPGLCQMCGLVMISRVKSPPNPDFAPGGGGGGGSHITMIGA